MRGFENLKGLDREQKGNPIDFTHSFTWGPVPPRVVLELFFVQSGASYTCSEDGESACWRCSCYIKRAQEESEEKEVTSKEDTFGLRIFNVQERSKSEACRTNILRVRSC